MEYTDKKGAPFEVRAYRDDDCALLAEMYARFTPKARFQGVPPVEENACRDWTNGLIAQGENFIALRERRVIGHVVVIPNTHAGDGEYLIFVSQSDRNRGVGSRLTEAAIGKARGLGLVRLWLSVGTSNFLAIRLYRKFGFDFCSDDRMECERIMRLELQDSPRHGKGEG
jgi:ribosomal protein S18 acetylase RimI-like enzyme